MRDQTWATAAMLCLADTIETAQGDCSSNDIFSHKKNGVYSYGNRLICDWKEEDGKNLAWFRWGNSQIYRKFFTDYQNFLRRPVIVGREIAQSYVRSELIYIVNLDLSKFYDNIDRDLLIKKIKKICKRFTNHSGHKKFWTSFRKITDWKWTKDDLSRAEGLGIPIKGKLGIPQGLVSAGFFANAYMLDFDCAVGKHINNKVPNTTGIILHDYCRYVDDLRLVVSIEEPPKYTDIAASVTNWLNEMLSSHACENLLFNPDKTSVISLKDLAGC
ncbi:RNA-directed DNA polymerase [Microbulbifer sp. 2201CG32-9]